MLPVVDNRVTCVLTGLKVDINICRDCPDFAGLMGNWLFCYVESSPRFIRVNSYFVRWQRERIEGKTTLKWGEWYKQNVEVV